MALTDENIQDLQVNVLKIIEEKAANQKFDVRGSDKKYILSTKSTKQPKLLLLRLLIKKVSQITAKLLLSLLELNHLITKIIAMLQNQYLMRYWQEIN